MAWTWTPQRAVGFPALLTYLNTKMDELQRALVTPEPIMVLRYGASITPDAARARRRAFQLTVPDGDPFTVNAPVNAQRGAELTLDILNSSGGTMGTPTFGAGYKLAGAFTKPANGKRRTITFYVAAPSELVEISRAAGDI